MSVTRYLSERGVIHLSGSTKAEAFSELAGELSALVTGLGADEILAQVWAREETFSTRITDDIAIPHAITKNIGRTVMAFGISRDGIPYDARNEKPVRIIVMMIGSEEDHLDALREIASVLQAEGIVERLLAVKKTEDAYALLIGSGEVKRPSDAEDLQVSELTLSHALSFARQAGASRIIIHVDDAIDLSQYRNLLEKVENVMIVHSGNLISGPTEFREDRLFLPFRDLGRSSKVEIALLFLISQGIIDRGERIVNISGEAGSGVLDSFMLTDIEQEFRRFFSMDLDDKPADLQPQVFTRLLQLAHTLAVEGREGKPVGTFFVLGDFDSVRSHCQQLIINPFRGYPEEERNILDPSLEETIKEFSRIDGAFVIRGDGVIMSAGTFIRPGDAPSVLIAGLGARHAAAATITAATKAVSIAVSESTRKVSLFKRGQRFLLF